MNSNLTNLTPATTGRRYWRSLDELADTPEFKQWVEREFPSGASELTDPVSRRHFLKIMAASFAFAGVATLGGGCRRPEEKLEPFGQQPANYIYGKPEFYATAMPTRTGAVPLVAKSYEGRPIKVEGNALYPGSNGGTDRYAQASILDLYDPDRAKRFTRAGKTVSREDALKFLDDLSKKFVANQGQGLVFLAESSTSPSRARLQKIFARKFPMARWFTYDAIDSGIHQRAATQAFNQPLRPVFHFEKAKVILSLDCDFIGGEDDAHNNIASFVKGRKVENGGMNRLYAVESLFTLTGASADHRLRVAASLVGEIAAAIAATISGSTMSVPAGVDAKWIAECVRDLLANRGKVLVVAGQRQPVKTHLLAHAINSALGVIGNTVSLIPATESAGVDWQRLDGTAETLVILGGNPVYNSNWSPRAKTVVRLGYYEDETSAKSNWNFPATHYLESWGDAATSDGIFVPVQPLIQPLFGGLTELEFLARLAGESHTNPYEIVRATFSVSEELWKQFLFDGFLAGSPAAPTVKNFGAQTPVVKPVVTSAKNLEVIFYRDAKMDDGRYANNGWMQELPDPITKLTWDNAVLVSRKTARELGVQNGDLVEISLNGRSVTGPIWTQPGMADYSLGLALGYGRSEEHTSELQSP